MPGRQTGAPEPDSASLRQPVPGAVPLQTAAYPSNRAWTLALHICRLSISIDDVAAAAAPGGALAAQERARILYGPVLNFASELAEGRLAQVRRSEGTERFCHVAGELVGICLSSVPSAAAPLVALREQALAPILDQLLLQMSGEESGASSPSRPSWQAWMTNAPLLQLDLQSWF